MSKVFDIAKWVLTSGKEKQNFLGAKWIPAFLDKVPEKSRRKWALRILSLSPHYFIDSENPEFAAMSTDEYLDASYDIITRSREEIYDKILQPHLEKDYEILEYGCGPGFVAKAVSPHVKKVFACDISNGALACGEIINNAANIEYIVADDAGLAKIPDQSLDCIYSYEVIQHLTDEIFESVLDNCYRKLKQGGKILLHIQLPDKLWKSEQDWKSDQTLKGKLKYKYGLHCFSRTLEQHREIIEKHKLSGLNFLDIKNIETENPYGLKSQKLLVAYK